MTKTVILATHCPNNSVESFYAHSLAESIKLLMINDITPILVMINDVASSIVAKNEAIAMAADQEFDSLVFIGHDILWDPSALLSVINSSRHALALPCAKKSGTNVRFDVEIGPEITRDDSGYIKVNYASCSFFKLSKQLITELSDTSLSIKNETGREVKNRFDNNTSYGQYFNEDVVLCNKIRELGHQVWINPISTCAHSAGNIYAADFAANLMARPSTDTAVKDLYA